MAFDRLNLFDLFYQFYRAQKLQRNYVRVNKWWCSRNPSWKSKNRISILLAYFLLGKLWMHFCTRLNSDRTFFSKSMLKSNRTNTSQKICFTMGSLTFDLGNFGENCSAFGSGWKTQFFWVGHFKFFFSKKNFFFCFILIQISHNLWCTKEFSKFWWLPWFPAKS